MIIQRDPAFSDTDLDRASTEVVGKMDYQGIGDHNSGNITSFGPAQNPEDHNSQATANGYGPVR